MEFEIGTKVITTLGSGVISDYNSTSGLIGVRVDGFETGISRNGQEWFGPEEIELDETKEESNA